MFTLPEVKLLMDAVESSKFITARKSSELADKLSQMTSVYQSEELKRNIYISKRVKPMNEQIYYNSMKLAMDNGIRSIAFPSISTGVYSFPVELAAKIAVHTVSRFLQNNPDCFDLVEWVLFDTHTESVYESEVDKL